ncbi:MAG TPA: M67 family metallopeptidase [Nitrososphaera sp.]|jgi:proteasome lid subunit RPN8/RPN11
MEQTTIISLTAGQVEEITKIARDAFPNESCAFLLGENDVTTTTVKVAEILPMQNADKSQVSFSIEPQEVLSAYALAEKKKLQVIGIFHSHPGRPEPSSTDKKFMEINPVVWLIYSTTEHRLKAYIYDSDVREVVVKVITE